ncbi:hypothetical protein [Desulfonema magnum]|uniref:Phage baseplate protein n=1 Tax=Desulfonema magnum TaxID=45655 RepID=A0A975BP96_9BACT|nr:hypothetical protein [Desulfonema magnum]QTA89105.1 Uncharacterized protein dnm_051530 [Desulfonema magnum]
MDNDKILRVWELAQQQHPVDQAMIILQTAFPEKSWDDLALLSIGQRNDLLLLIRERTFGRKLHGVAKCDQCSQELEFIADVDELRDKSGTADRDKSDERLKFEAYEMKLRLINSFDLAAAANCSDVKSARRLLAERAILELSCARTEISAGQLPDSVIAVISERIAESDPQANMKIEVECPECGSELLLPIDIAAYLWREIEAQAKRLLREVSILARYYGWREADILGMSAVRRHQYMEMAES